MFIGSTNKGRALIIIAEWKAWPVIRRALSLEPARLVVAEEVSTVVVIAREVVKSLLTAGEATKSVVVVREVVESVVITREVC